MHPLPEIEGVGITTATSTEDICKNIISNREGKYTEIYDCVDWRTSMPIAIVGGGPSLIDTIDQLRPYKHIMACGSVHDYLVENNVVMDWCVVCDPDKIVIDYMTKPQKHTKYLIASQCDPAVFEYLKDYQVYIWHAMGDNLQNSVFGENSILISGGCTVGTRAMGIAIAFGYYIQHLFGFDTCLDDNYKHHAYDFRNKEETIGNITEIKIGGPDSPTFKVAGYMLGQFFDFKQLLKIYADKLDVTVYGKGLLKYIVDYGKELAPTVEKEANGNKEV